MDVGRARSLSKSKQNYKKTEIFLKPLALAVYISPLLTWPFLSDLNAQGPKPFWV